MMVQSHGLQLFQMAEVLNGASNQEFSFKLTELLLPSFVNSKTSLPAESSLEYSVSRISIQEMLHDDQGHDWFEKTQMNSISPIKNCSFKESTLKNSSINTTQASLNPTKRPLSSKRAEKRLSFGSKLAFRVFNFEQSLNRKAGNGEEKRQEQRGRRRSLSFSQKIENSVTLPTNHSQAQTTRLKLKLIEGCSLMHLKKSLQVRPIALQVDQSRQKNYLTRIIQARSNSFHNTQPTRTPLRSYRHPHAWN